jgi:hypothetical protein
LHIFTQNSLTGSQEVAIVIAMNSCTDGCPSPKRNLGQILYNGPFNPTSTELGFSNQSFTVKVPTLDKGTAILSVTHLSLIEVRHLQLRNFTIHEH